MLLPDNSPTAAEPGSKGDLPRLLRPGNTCWRLAGASRLAFIIDGERYFALAKEAIRRARHSVYLVGWDFDLRIKLNPGEAGGDDGPDKLGRFLNWLVRRRPELQIYVLKWDGSMIRTIGRQIVPFLALQWLTHDKVHYQLDSEHPAGASHHQKLIVVDDSVAFCGGIDMTDDRWDTRDHRSNDPRRTRPSGEPYGPWHDMATIVEGDAAAALGDLARERWFRATGDRLLRPRSGRQIWPEQLQPVLRNVEIGIARTAPAYHSRPQVTEIENLYLAAIAAAREVIYLESQYCASARICEALADRLREPKGPEVIIINPESAESWLEAEVMDSSRRLAVSTLREADFGGRFGIYQPVNDIGEPIYVHAKVLASDDRLLRVGSSNLNNRSMGFDTECDLALEAVPGSADERSVRMAIATLRDDLVAEHLGVSIERFVQARQENGSVLQAIELLRSSNKRRKTLRPLVLQPLNSAERALAESRMFDPERPGRGETHLEHFVKSALQPIHVHAFCAAGFLAGVLLLRGFRHFGRHFLNDSPRRERRGAQ